MQPLNNTMIGWKAFFANTIKFQLKIGWATTTPFKLDLIYTSLKGKHIKTISFV